MAEATTSSLLELYQLKEKDCNQQISSLHLNEISLNYCQKWRFLPARLKLKDIVADDISRGPGNEEDKRYTFFLKWKQIKGSEATYKRLISALLEIKCKQDAEGVCRLLQQSISERMMTPPAINGAFVQTSWRKWLYLGSANYHCMLVLVGWWRKSELAVAV